MDKLLVGNIITVPGVLEGTNIVLSRIEKENLIYALITKIDGKIDFKNQKITNTVIDISKSFVISYDKKTEKIDFDSNKEIIRLLLNKMKNNE